MDMNLREATPLDTADIVGLVNRAYRPSFENGGWTHERDLVQGNRTEYELPLVQAHWMTPPCLGQEQIYSQAMPRLGIIWTVR
ncbi:MAG: hypothetical protein Q7U16_04020 [Agitococcus sp.]|nr:hypothetical protein [Agitococcus sp.]